MKPEDGIPDDLAAMRRYARALTRDEQDADDVVQEAMVRAIERRRTFDPKRDRQRWLLAIVHNVFVSTRRRIAAEERRNDRLAHTLLPHADLDHEHRVRLAAVSRAFESLSGAHRAVLHLVAVEGLSYQEAADILDIPVGTVMSRLARARDALRQAERGPAPLRLAGGRDG